MAERMTESAAVRSAVERRRARRAGERPGTSRRPTRSVIRGGCLALALVAAAAVTLPAEGQRSRQEARWASVAGAVPDEAALRTLAPILRRGGLTLFCRHAITDHDASDRGPSREQQRNLDAAGRAQSERMGRDILGAGIPVGDVRASPMFRTMDTGELAFGQVTADSRLRGSDGVDALRRLLADRPEGVRVLVSHQGTIRRVVAIGRAPLEEGDCLVLRPDGDAFEVLARMGADDWRRLPRR